MKMGGVGFSILILILVIIPSLGVGYASGGEKNDDPCSESHKCDRHGPEIKFPFSIRNQHPEWCRQPGFDVSCQDGRTIIILDLNSNLFSSVIEYIDYSKEEMTVNADRDKPNNSSIWVAFFHGGNLTHSSPFLFFSNFINYTFVNCSTGASSYLMNSISGLSDKVWEVSILDPQAKVSGLPVSCQTMMTIPVSVEVIHYYHWVTKLRWDMPRCKACILNGTECGISGCIHRPNKVMEKCIKAVAITGSSLLLIAMAICILVCRSWKQKKKLDLENEIRVEKFLEEHKSITPTRYSYADLKKMTDNFRDKIGQGGFGSVFKGYLPDGTIVAVKMLHYFGGGGEEFINEVVTIGRIHHVNVVRLLGFCTDRLKRALIYEFMPNDSLEKFIFSRGSTSRERDQQHHLQWEKLHEIALGIARGIEYLHQGCEQRILHFDIKPHNILLDHNLNPKISDFGLAKLCSKGQSAVSMTAVRGTRGYIAPEIYSRNFGNVSHKSDVYSFGMLLLEMVGGRKNIDAAAETASQVYFPEWIYKRLCEGEEGGSLGLRFESADEDDGVARKLAVVALWCIQWYPVDRPAMKAVVGMLEGDSERVEMPPSPFAPSNAAENKAPPRVNGNLPTISE